LIEKQYEVMPTAPFFPVVSELVADRDEGVWVGIYAPPDQSEKTWLRLLEGGVSCELRLPRSFEMVESGSGWFLGYDADSLGVQSVQLWGYGS